ncbi:hypothetical protein PAXRUDRAFT_826812 [Paxillus rubicundulus Ve08.2h10]|uniref:Uncharacterized protein n=1 Tax=Paxillus rubicundulus Ve08.2h10 TaxID=930991 RepID=A0A0D0DE01_9AGAM|nr:hypothetical protein PAXRUDRAFT_826812 [Paxillus rubicundulus Ve08.2h10]
MAEAGDNKPMDWTPKPVESHRQYSGRIPVPCLVSSSARGRLAVVFVAKAGG